MSLKSGVIGLPSKVCTILNNVKNLLKKSKFSYILLCDWLKDDDDDDDGDSNFKGVIKDIWKNCSKRVRSNLLNVLVLPYVI